MQHRQPQLYHPQSHPMHGPSGPQFEAQSQYLDSLVSLEVARVEMSEEEISSKDLFRLRLEQICQGLKETHADKVLPSVTLQSFGSLSSGFASTGSDMDLAIVTDSLTSAEQKHLSLDENSLPRVLERALLDLGIGARLLTRTRVPIIKICETPSRELLDALLAERERWDALPDEEKYTSSNPANNDTASKDDVQTAAPLESQRELGKVGHGLNHSPIKSVSLDSDPKPDTPAPDQVAADSTAMPTDLQPPIPEAAKQRSSKQWKRERAAGPLDFPKQGVGIQCDINFFNPLGLFNTKLLRCYSKCDSRVRPMVLFIKTWAKHRKINSSYSGTLSSYGYVLMVLHYLVNIAKPPVLPNLQLEAARAGLPTTTFDGWDVRFLGDEDDIVDRAARGLITQNREPLGVLLRGFFQYFASTGGQGFIWMQNVLSLRTPGGILRKDEKGWTGAKTEVGDNHKEVRHRYLFAIEDPFELTHNVARTVTHNGIVAIRDEFRRSWRILQAVGRGLDPRDGELLAALDEDAEVIRTNPPTAPAAMTAPVETVKQNQPYAEAFPVLGLSSKPTISPQHAPIVRPDQTPASNKTRFPRHSNGNRSQRGARHGNPAGEGAPSLR
ncbi:hypothetical protein AAFC00_005958 [Neodothiora populina]|uniref:polynucleotide adenylyltransferase n=1 Tax=Neodothiora populina TaxID=2781224 RepID=A0ABR3P6Q9_9PEZI